MSTRSPIPYYGGKTSTAARIVEHLPPHRHYVEPFAGSLAVLLAKPVSRMETVNDLDQSVMTFWRVLRDRPDELERVCQLTPHSRAEWESCQDIEAAPDDLEVARRLWVRLTQSRTGRLVRAGWRHYVSPGAVSTAFPSYLDGYVDRMAAARQRLHHVTLECRPALEVIQTYGADPDVLLYVDPPYLGSTRAQDRSYRHELMTDDEHRDLAAALRACRSSVVLSGYASELYDSELFGDWHRVTLVSGTGQGDDRWSNRVEVLWINRDPQPALFTLDGGGVA